MRDITRAAKVQAATLQKVLRLLEGLNVSDTGRELYQQVSRMLSDFEAANREKEQTLIASTGFLLDAISTHLPAESRLMARISLLRARLSPPIDYIELYALRRALEDCADSITLQDNVEHHQVSQLITPLLTAFGLGKADETPHINKEQGSVAVEEDAFRQQSTKEEKDSQGRDSVVTRGMDIVMESLAAHEKIREGLDKSKAFGEFIELELATIRNIDRLEQLDERKDLLESELESILRNHHQLVDYFKTVSSYLSLVQNEGQRLNEELNRMTTLSLTDELTGLPNRRAFLKRMKDEISRAQRYGNSLALALVDLDRFKPINDNYGHPVGDAVLKSYSEDVLTTFRQNDMVARYGGEEFAVVFPNTSVDGAYKALEKVLKRANESHLQYERETISLPGFSAGLVLFQVGESLEDLIERADDALYEAKKSGRNRIEVSLIEPAGQD